MSSAESGIFHGAAQALYNNTVRQFLPRKWGVLNGVAVRSFRLLDLQDTQPNHKDGLLSAIREVVSPTDSVVDIATGRGITATVSARAGEKVYTYEAAAEMIEIARTTLKHNVVWENVEIHHALVEAPGELFGDAARCEDLSVGDLPSVDVWVLDCEGAEIEILEAAKRLDALPRAMIVESHPDQDAPIRKVSRLLEELGYVTETRQFQPGETDPEKKVILARLEHDS